MGDSRYVMPPSGKVALFVTPEEGDLLCRLIYDRVDDFTEADEDALRGVAMHTRARLAKHRKRNRVRRETMMN